MEEDRYFNELPREGLTVPSKPLADFTSNVFAILDFTAEFIQTSGITQVMNAAKEVLKKYAIDVEFVCNDHLQWEFKINKQDHYYCI